MTLQLSLRTRAGMAAGALAGRASRTSGRGRGGTLPGRVLLQVDPSALQRLTAGRRCVLVSGTNGKTTTTRMLADAVKTVQPVVTNTDGSNLVSGVASTLLAGRRTDWSVAVLELDELALTVVAAQLEPSVFVLLNLSRDQLDRMMEVRMIADRWRRMFASLPSATVVANADDPMVVAAVMGVAESGGRVVWAAAGRPWQLDAASCPLCTGGWDIDGPHWRCVDCGFSRPRPSWRVDDDYLVTPSGTRVPLRLQLPGRANRSNALMAVAAAELLGAEPTAALVALRELRDVQGRYLTTSYRGQHVRLLLAKNPASWLEALDQLDDIEGIVVVVLNARAADGRDPSWIYDVPFDLLNGREIVVAGERAADLSVRLCYAEVPHKVVPDPLVAMSSLGGRPCVVVANYTAFTDLLRAVAPHGRE